MQGGSAPHDKYSRAFGRERTPDSAPTTPRKGVGGILMLLCVLCSGGSMRAEDKPALPVLTRIAQIRSLTPQEARRKYPISVRGVITYNAPEYGVTFVQDSTAGIFLFTINAPTSARAGDLVEVNGITGPGEFAPSIDRPRIHVIGHASFPAPRRVPVDDLFTGKEDSQWISIEGIVRSTGIDQRLPPDMRAGPPFLVLGIAAGNNKFRINIGQSEQRPDYDGLVDAAVSIRGVCATLFNDKRQLVGIQVFVPGMEMVTVTEAVRPGPYELPVLPTSGLMQFSPENVLGHRVRVRGVVTLHKPGRHLFVQDASGGVDIESTHMLPVQPGDLVDAAGFPATRQFTPILEDAVFRKIGTGALPTPADLTGASELSGALDAQLVRIQGTLIDQTAKGADRVLTLQKGSLIFTAQLELPAEDDGAPPIQNGSLLQMTGVWSVETDKYRRPTAFRVALRSAADIRVIRQPSWWTATRILALLAILCGTILTGALWVIVLRRRVDERTETVRATLESTADGILVIDSAGKVAAHNRKFSEMWQFPESVLRSRSDRKLLECAMTQVKDPEQFLARVQALYADREAQTDDTVEFKDGRIFERHSEPQRVKDRSVGRVWGFRDVTDQRRAQNALRRSEERVRQLFASVPHPILVYDLESMRLLEVNDRAIADYGYSRKEFQDMRVGDLLLTEEVVLPARGATDLQAPPRATSEWQIKTKSGQVVDSEVSRAVLKHDGRRAALVIAVDITERKRVQEEREKLIFQLKQALSKVKQLSGMLPICACCKKVRDDTGYWKQLEGYLVEHSDAVLSHSICPQCMDKYYSEYNAEENEDEMAPGANPAV